MVTEVLEAVNVDEEGPVTLADSVAGLSVTLTDGVEMVEMGASEVRDSTP